MPWGRGTSGKVSQRRIPWAEFWEISIHSPGSHGGGHRRIWEKRAVWTEVKHVKWSPMSGETARNTMGLEYRFKVMTKGKA